VRTDVVSFRHDLGPIPVDSDAEIAALLSLWEPGGTGWTGRERRYGRTPDGRATVTVRVGDAEVTFDTTSYAGSSGLIRGGTDTTQTLDLVTSRAQAFSAENPPHHPGTVARFPVPSPRYARSVEVPLPVVAVDRDVRGLYAPPRVALLGWPEAAPSGVGEFPGFDPMAWPPPRLGEWPPPWVASAGTELVAAAVARFSACWVRIVDAAMTGEMGRVSGWDRSHGRALRALLDILGMGSSYRTLNPAFDDWLGH